MKRVTIRLISWLLGTALGIFGFVMSRGIYIESFNKVKEALFSMDFERLISEDFWIGTILPFIMLAGFIIIGKIVIHLIIKLFCLIIY